MADATLSFTGRIAGIFSAGPVKPGDSYGAPGAGRSLGISVATTVALIFLWWLVTYMGTILTRHTVRDDGCTPYERIKRKKGVRETPEFGEKLLYPLPHRNRLRKLDPKWRYGTYGFPSR